MIAKDDFRAFFLILLFGLQEVMSFLIAYFRIDVGALKKQKKRKKRTLFLHSFFVGI